MRAVFGRGVWRAIAIGLVVVAGCEAASRVAEPYAGVPFGVGVLAKQPRLDYLASRGECRDIVFFGSICFLGLMGSFWALERRKWA